MRPTVLRRVLRNRHDTGETLVIVYLAEVPPVIHVAHRAKSSDVWGPPCREHRNQDATS